MWHQYRVELYPDFGQVFAALPTGPLTAAAFFRQTRDRRAKGIVQLLQEA
jgi:hypothetical protein